MSNLPNFRIKDYNVIQKLGYNQIGERITYLAVDKKTQQEVVIKEFRFAKKDSKEKAYKIDEREINVLKQLQHPSIPRYLDSFSTENGFYLIQEYKKAPSLAEKNDFTLLEIKKIAISILKILVYLQTRKEPVFHRDIKPENILVDKNLNIYLIDFGLTRMDDNNSDVSSIDVGTIGFMSHEQLYKNHVNKSSDLYSLGITLMCLLTKTPSAEVGWLIYNPEAINFEGKIPSVHPDFIKWLKKMVALESKNRFSDAKSALNQLKSIPIQGHSFSEKLGNSFKNTLTLIGKNKPILIIIIIGIIGIKVTPKILAQKRLQTQREKTAQSLYINEKCPKCDLQNVNFDYANLEDFNLTGANLEGANLWYANLKDANLEGANLENTNLRGANLMNANLKDANLEDANLKGNDDEITLLQNANLENANLKKTNLKGTNLEGANLEGANLEGTNLEGANLKKTNLKGTNLEEAKSLKNADFTDAIMPDGIDTP